MKLKQFKMVSDEVVFSELYVNKNFETLNKKMLKQNVEADFETDEE